MSTTLLGHLALATGEIERARALLWESADAFQDIGNPIYLSWCLEGMAGVAVTERRFHLAAELCVARDALLARIAAKLPPMHPSAYQQTIATMNTALGIPDVTAATDRHRPLDELIMTAGRNPCDDPIVQGSRDPVASRSGPDIAGPEGTGRPDERTHVNPRRH